MKRYIIAALLIMLALLTVPLFGMTEATAKNQAKQLWGMNARIAKVYVPKTATSWTVVYLIGVQEYWPSDSMVDTPFGPMPNPRRGQPHLTITCKGFGSSWDAAFKSYAANAQCRWME